MRAALLCSMLLLSLAAAADETGRPAGDNCNVQAPPDSAGEVADRDGTLKVFPRAREIGPAYAGCQARWSQSKKGWALSGLAVIAKGEPVRFWKPEVSFVTCIYDKGKVVLGDPKACPEQKDLILRSYPSGCVEKFRLRAGQGGNPSPQVPGCDLQ